MCDWSDCFFLGFFGGRSVDCSIKFPFFIMELPFFIVELSLLIMELLVFIMELEVPSCGVELVVFFFLFLQRRLQCEW